MLIAIVTVLAGLTILRLRQAEPGPAAEESGAHAATAPLELDEIRAAGW